MDVIIVEQAGAYRARVNSGRFLQMTCLGVDIGILDADIDAIELFKAAVFIIIR